MRSVMQWRNRAAVLCLIVALGLTACGADDITQHAPSSTGALRPADSAITLPRPFGAAIYAQGLRSPTAMAWGPDGKLYVTQLNGGENAGTGQVVVIDQGGASPVAVLDNIRKPTGLAWRDDELYVVAERDVVRTRQDEAGAFEKPEAIIRDLPFNGRSEGQIDLLPDGSLIFETSGSVGNLQSGQLLTLGRDETVQSTLATGLKNAYGVAYDSSTKRLYATEIGDDRMDGKPPPEEINLIEPDGDYGWPYCYDEATPARDRGGDEARCATTRTPLVTFPPGSTPTGLMFYDRDDVPEEYRRALYVAIWNRTPEVQRVVIEDEGGTLRGEATSFMGNAGRPIDLVAHPDGGLLVLDFDGGIVYLVRADRNGS
jgi:glucose/arabinose dehydrogenase